MFFYESTFLGTKFCESILLPTEHTLKQSLEATFLNVNRGAHFNGKDQIDSCCRSLHKCDAYQRIALNQTNDSLWDFRHCDCLYFFQICLDHVNTSLSNEVAFLHSINTTKCYKNDYPIIECIKFESLPYLKAPFLRFVNQAEREKFFNRCSKYELDKNRLQQLQFRDVPFNYHGMSTNDTRNMSHVTFIPHQSRFVIINWQNFMNAKCSIDDFVPSKKSENDEHFPYKMTIFIASRFIFRDDQLSSYFI